MISAQEFQKEIAKKIPIVAQMGMEIIEFSPSRVLLRVKFLPNKNHVNTVFGGSLYSGCALACYALFRAVAEDFGFTEDFLVIQNGEIDYLKPVGGDFEIRAEVQPHLDMKRFLDSVKRQGKGRLPLESKVIWNKEECAVFRGNYVMRIPKAEK